MGLSGTAHFAYKDALYFLPEQNCPICGKHFEPTNQWVYRHNYQLLCSWGCLNKYRRRYKWTHCEGIADRRYVSDEDIEQIRKYLSEGMKQCEMCRIMGISSQSMSAHVKKIRNGEE